MSALALGVFVRAPRPGQTKTRLAASVGPELASALARAFAEDLVVRLATRASLTLFVAGDRADPWVVELAARHGLAVRTQEGASLGARMARALRDLREDGPGPCGLVGSDLPTLPAWVPAALVDPLARGGADVTLAPAADGGYVALALGPDVDPGFLEREIRYSSVHALADTEAAVRAAGLRPARISPWYDVDVAEDLRVLRAELARDPGRAPRTAAALARLDQSSGGSPGGAAMAGGNALGRKGTGGSNTPHR